MLWNAMGYGYPKSFNLQHLVLIGQSYQHRTVTMSREVASKC